MRGLGGMATAPGMRKVPQTHLWNEDSVVLCKGSTCPRGQAKGVQARGGVTGKMKLRRQVG